MSPSTTLPLKFAFFFSLSLATTTSFTITHRKLSKPKLKATTSDLLSLLGPPNQAQSVNPQIAKDLYTCLKFIVPFNPTQHTTLQRRSLYSEKSKTDNLILYPPGPVLELARLAFDSGSDPDAIIRTLDPFIITVPDVEGCNEDKCELTRTPYGRRFINEELNAYMELLFETIVERGPSVGLNVTLSRYDFFHGHVFVVPESGRLGILFHAKEYPAYDKQVFPYNMGYCQVGSNVAYDNSMNLRNILWLAPLPSNSTNEWLVPGVLVVLDANPEGIIYRDLIPNYVKYARTLYEEDFGEVVVDVNYLNVGAQVPNFQIFIC